MALTSTINVYHPDGSPCRKVRVVLGFQFGGMTKESYTDDHGRAQITHSSTGNATVYVSGKNVGSFHAPGATTVTYR